MPLRVSGQHKIWKLQHQTAKIARQGLAAARTLRLQKQKKRKTQQQQQQRQQMRADELLAQQMQRQQQQMQHPPPQRQRKRGGGDVGLNMEVNDMRRIDLRPPTLSPAPAAGLPMSQREATALLTLPPSGQQSVVLRLREGMVLIKNFLSPTEQQAIVDLTREIGLGDGGFYRPSYGNRGKQQLFMMVWGWHWNLQSRLYHPTITLLPPSAHK